MVIDGHSSPLFITVAVKWNGMREDERQLLHMEWGEALQKPEVRRPRWFQ
jgi:hypothetical protein